MSDPTAAAAEPVLQPAPGDAVAGRALVAMGAGKPATKPALFSAEAWSPLKVELFRSLYIATSIAQIGTWVREAGGPWLMKLLTDGRHDQPAMVARVVVFSSLPICLFSVFAGALADVLDRRRLLIVTQIWMLIVSAVLGILTIANLISPGGLLALTFLLGVGTAAAGPALQALLPELVPRPELPLAINLNSVALNVARALGPAMFILVISVLHGRYGVGASFILTALSFTGAIWVLMRWNRPPQRAAVHGEEMWGAIRSGFRYNLHSPANRAILLRVFSFIVPAVVMWTQVPIIATRQLGLAQERAEQGSAALFAFVGLGAIFGVLVMPGLQKRYKIDPVVNVCTLLFACGLILLSFTHHLWIAAIIMVFLGINWVIIPTSFNTATQVSVPMWVKGRAISFYLTVLFGSFAIGGALWGRVTTAKDISTSLRAGGISMAAMLLLAPFFPLTLNEGRDLSPLRKPGAPPEPGGGLALVPEIPAPDEAPGLVEMTVDYAVRPEAAADFRRVMCGVRQVRRRNGATFWRLEPQASDNDDAILYRERFLFGGTGEYSRHPARMTRSDADILQQAMAFLHEAEGAPPVTTNIRFGVPHPVGVWAQTRIATSVDRAFEELGRAFDRAEALRKRERELKEWKVTLALRAERRGGT